MQFTLDSVEHAKAILEDLNPGQKVTYRPVLVNNSNKEFITDENSKKYFFGILTAGTGTELKVNFINGNITIPEENQIIELFKSLDITSTETDNFQFRGFELTLQ
mgnify:CR=1 FL=1